MLYFCEVNRDNISMSYSLDFRRNVVINIESGMSWDDALTIFKISRYSLARWLRLYRTTGDVLDVPRGIYKAKKIPSNNLLSILASHPDLTLEELSIKFSCSKVAIWKRCKSLGITRKKNHTISRKRSKKA